MGLLCILSPTCQSLQMSWAWYSISQKAWSIYIEATVFSQRCPRARYGSQRFTAGTLESCPPLQKVLLCGQINYSPDIIACTGKTLDVVAKT